MTQDATIVVIHKQTYYTFWASPKLRDFWCYVFNILTKVLEIIYNHALFWQFSPAETILYGTKEKDIIAFITHRILLA